MTFSNQFVPNQSNFAWQSMTVVWAFLLGGAVLFSLLLDPPPPSSTYKMIPPCSVKTLDLRLYSNYKVCQSPCCPSLSGGCCPVCCSSLWQKSASNEGPGTETNDDGSHPRSLRLRMSEQWLENDLQENDRFVSLRCFRKNIFRPKLSCIICQLIGS